MVFNLLADASLQPLAPADAAIAEETTRALANVNARIKAQRGGRGGRTSRTRGEGGWTTEDRDAARSRASARHEIEALAQRHGIQVRFLDEGYASAVARIRELAVTNRIRLLVDGEEVGGEDWSGSEDSGTRSNEETAAAAVGEAASPSGAEATGPGRDGGGSSTPPPMLPSLRPAPARSQSTSPVPRSASKVSRGPGAVRLVGAHGCRLPTWQLREHANNEDIMLVRIPDPWQPPPEHPSSHATPRYSPARIMQVSLVVETRACFA